MNKEVIKLSVQEELANKLNRIEKIIGIKKEDFIINEVAQTIYRMEIEQIEKGVNFFR